MAMLRGLVSLMLGVVLIVIGGCNGSDQTQISDKAYFPLRVGNYHIYQVTETDIQNGSCNAPVPPSKTYQLKVFVYDSVKNSAGGYTYNIHRYTRLNDTQAWSNLDTWSARVTTNQVIVNEGNSVFVKFLFPLNANSKWNGNQYNNLPAEDYTIQNFRRAYPLDNGNNYSLTFTVVQSDNQDFFVYQDKRIEVYAASVGLVYKETTQLTYIQDVCYGQQRVKSGIIYKQELKSYGRE